jgi:hypothetical protein
MFKKVVSSWMLLVMMAFGTVGNVARQGVPAPVVQSAAAGQTLPVAPASAQFQAPARVQLSTAQMASAHGDGWLSKLWNKYKKKIIKFIWEIISEIITDKINNITSTADANITGTVTETYEGTDVTTDTYQDQAGYDAGQLLSSEYSEGGYDYVSTDYSGGCYCGGDDGGPRIQEAYAY